MRKSSQCIADHVSHLSALSIDNANESTDFSQIWSHLRSLQDLKIVSNQHDIIGHMDDGVAFPNNRLRKLAFGLVQRNPHLYAISSLAQAIGHELKHLELNLVYNREYDTLHSVLCQVEQAFMTRV